MNELIKRKQAYAAANANNAKKEEQPCNELENCNEKCVGCNATSCENYENCVKNKNIILKELKEKID